MLAARRIISLCCALLGMTGAASGQFTKPNPDVFARAEDQQRARLITTKCTAADEGKGCYRYDGRLIREAPCAFHVEHDAISSLPTDQCFKMNPARRYRGIWIDVFEGQQFIPEGTKPPEWPRERSTTPGWREKADQAIAATIWLNTERTKLGHARRQGGRRIYIDFIGRSTMFLGNYGHMGLSGHEIIVDRVIAAKECPKDDACRFH